MSSGVGTGVESVSVHRYGAAAAGNALLAPSAPGSQSTDAHSRADWRESSSIPLFPFCVRIRLGQNNRHQLAGLPMPGRCQLAENVISHNSASDAICPRVVEIQNTFHGRMQKLAWEQAPYCYPVSASARATPCVTASTGADILDSQRSQRKATPMTLRQWPQVQSLGAG